MNTVIIDRGAPTSFSYILPDSISQKPDQVLVKGSFLARLAAICAAKQSVLCVGLDPDPDKLPYSLRSSTDVPSAVRTFLKAVVETTAPFAAAYKFNLAFFEALGLQGWNVLSDLISSMPRNTMLIADAKRGDVGNSAKFYAKAFFEDFGFDAITISPYMGADSVLPFLEYEEKGVFLLVRTSNPGGNDFQTLIVDDEPLYMVIARKAKEWARDQVGSLGFVVGATDLEAMAALRAACPKAAFLIPGVGAQGGDAGSVMKAAGSGPVLVNSSRGILYASADSDFAARAASETDRLRAILWSGISERHPRAQ